MPERFPHDFTPGPNPDICMATIETATHDEHGYGFITQCGCHRDDHPQAMTDEPEGRAPPPPGGGAALYTLAFCYQCAAQKGLIEGSDPALDENYPGNYDLDQQNCVDWATAHVTDNPGHVIAMRQEVVSGSLLAVSPLPSEGAP
jgi:hypothetical protein